MNSNYFLIADNQDVTRAGLHRFIENGIGDSVCIDVRSEEALCAELKLHSGAVVIVDYALLDFSNVQNAINLRSRYPLSHWIVFSSELTVEVLRRFAIEDGFSVVMKDNSEDEIRSALKCAMRGERFLCHQVTNLLIEERSQHRRQGVLTPTEVEILKLIAKGKSVKEIAAERNSSTHTVITHKKNIFRKIDVNNVHEATKYALQAGLIDLVEYYI